MIYDTFIFFNELDLLDIRLNILNDYVDRFVLVESTRTFQGKPKPLFFDENKQRFSKFKDKIIHVIVDDTPDHGTPWDKEYFQRDAILRGLSACNSNDLIIVSDVDEIPNPEVIPKSLQRHQIGLFRQKLFYYHLNTKCVELDYLPWSLIVNFDELGMPVDLRKRVVICQSALLSKANMESSFTIIENGGWHFSYLGSPEQIVTKIEAFSHDELNVDEFKKNNNIQSLIANGKDLFGRKMTFSKVSLDQLPKFIVDNFSTYKDKGLLDFSLNSASINFDIYSRYKACSDLLRQTGFAEGDSVLDIGSGPECLFGQFMPDATMNYVDLLIPADSGQGYTTGNIFASELDGQIFDCVSAVDVLEHVPPEYRQAFIQRMSTLGKNTLILGFPTSDSSDALETDKAIDAQYHEIFGHDYTWLEEHCRYGLPSLTEIVEQLSQLGWHCQTIGHGHAPWLRGLLGFLICARDIPSLSNVVLAISEKFNRELYTYDFRPPYYRQFVIASRSPLLTLIVPPISLNIEAPDKAFRALMDVAKQQYFVESLRQLIASHQKIEELSTLVGAQHAMVLERDALIVNYNQKIEDVSVLSISQHKKNTSLEQALSDKQAELMKMSDWAQSMRLELNRTNIPIVSGVEKTAKRGGTLVRKILAQSFLGDMVRYMRNSRRFREKRASLEDIRQSVLDNQGRLIITFPIITWDFRWQRPQHIVSRLRDHGFSVLYVAMTLTPLGRRLQSNKDAIAQINFNELALHINQIWLNTSNQLNIYTDPVEGDDLYNISIELEALILELRPKSIVYLVQFPGWGAIAQDLQKKLGGKVVFDCMDDHGGFTTNTEAALKIEEVLIKSADLVITSSNLLEARTQLINPKTIQVKNGTEFEHFTNPIRNGKLDYLCERPIIGYYGAISDWFDMYLVAHCASQRPDWTFVLIGATFGAGLQPVEALENVHLLGEKPYQDLPGYLAYFDVCTIPFKIIPLTLATNPVKFYEYLSAGKPVVSMDLPELHAYRDDCYLACNPDEYLTQLELAYNERKDEQLISRRLKLASENSWDARVSAILEADIFKTYLNQN